MDLPQPLNSFSSVGQGQTANLKLRSGGGLAYARLLLDTEGTITDPTKIARFKLSLNNTTLIELTGPELVMRRKYNKQPDNSAAGLFEFDFRAPTNSYRSRQGRDSTSLVTEAGDVISLEVELAADAGANVILKGYSVNYVAAQKNPRGQSVPIQRTQVLRVFSQSFQAAATGEVQNYSMPQNGPRISRIHIGGLDGVIDSLRLERDTQSIFDLPQNINEAILVENGKEPQAGWFHYDPAAEGWNAQDLTFTQGAQSFIARMNCTTAGALKFIYETVEGV